MAFEDEWELAPAGASVALFEDDDEWELAPTGAQVVLDGQQPDIDPAVLGVDPDKAARVKQASVDAELPPDAAERQLDALEQNRRAQTIDDLTQGRPALRAAMTDTSSAAVLHDEAELLASVEDGAQELTRFAQAWGPATGAVQAAGASGEGGESPTGFGGALASYLSSAAKAFGQGSARLGGALVSAVPAFNAAAWGLVRGAAEAAGATDLSEYAKARASEQTQVAGDLNPTSGNFIEDSVYSGIASGAQTLMFAPTGMWGLLTSFGVLSGGQSITDALEAGKSPVEALAYGLAQGVVEAGFEAAPTQALLQMIGAKNPATMWQGFKKFLGTEAFTEQLTTVTQDWLEWKVLNPERSFADYMAARPSAAAETFIATLATAGAIGASVGVINRLSDRAVKAKQADQQQRALQNLMDRIGESKARQRDPEAFGQFVEDSLTGEALAQQPQFFIEGESFAQALNEAGTTIDALREQAPDLAAQLEEALATDSDVVIPSADFLTAFAGTQIGQALMPHVRTAVDAMSAAEAVAFNQTREGQVDQAALDAVVRTQEELRQSDSQMTVEDRLVEAMVATGRLTESQARVNAQLVSALYRAMGERTGRTAEELYDLLPLQVLGIDTGEARPVEQPVTRALTVAAGTDTSDPVAVARAVAGANSAQADGAAVLPRKLVEAVTQLADAMQAGAIGHDEGVQALRSALQLEGYDGVLASDSATPVHVDGLGRPVAQGKSSQVQGSFNPRSLTINLTQHKDLSTFVHETGHFALHMLMDLAARDDAPQQIRDDAETVLKWFGVESLEAWHSMTVEDQRPFHERFATATERYLMEGVAPAAELRGVFARVRRWMIGVYKRMSAESHAQFSDEVHAVFGRMLASDQAIEEAAERNDTSPLFETQEDAGLGDEEWARMQDLAETARNDAEADLSARMLRNVKWMRNARSRAIREMQARARQIRRTIREEVARQEDARPVRRAIAYITRGIDGVPGLTDAQRQAVSNLGAIKTQLSTLALRTMFGGGPAAVWRYLPSNTLAAQGGIHPDYVAEIFGFPSGDALVREMVAAGNRDAAIDRLTDERMMAEHGELLDPAAVQEAADAAVSNTAHARMVAAEAKALEDALNVREQTGTMTVRRGSNRGQVRAITVNGLLRAATAYAKRVVGGTRVMDLNATMYARAAAKAGRKAKEAMRRGDIGAALASKQSQMLLNAQAQQSREAVETARRQIDYLRKFRNQGTRKNIDIEYLERIDDILTVVDTRADSNRRIESAERLRQWVQSQLADGMPVALDPSVLSRLQARNVREYTVDELGALVEQVQSIEHLGRLKKKLLNAREQREFDAVATELAATVRQSGGVPRATVRGMSDSERGRLSRFRKFLAQHRKLSSFARQFDGVRDDGAWFRAIVRPMYEAGDRETSMMQAATDKLMAIYKPLLSLRGGLEGGKITLSNGESWTRGARVSFVLNLGNAANRQRAVATVGSEAMVREIVATLTPAELAAVTQTWAMLDEYWPDVAAQAKRISGVIAERVQAEPFEAVASDGTVVQMTGGYYPLVYDSDFSDLAARNDDLAVADALRGAAFTSAITAHGHEMKRLEKLDEPLLLSLQVLDRHLQQVIRDLSWRSWLVDTNRLLRDKRVAQAVRDLYGAEVLHEIRKAVVDVARGDEDQDGGHSAAFLANWARMKASVATMAWSVTTAMLQPFGVFQSVPRVGGKWIMAGYRHWAGDALRLRNSITEIRSKSEFMRHRYTTLNKEIRDVMARISFGKSKAAQIYDASLFYTMQKLQLVADIPTWWGAYEKAMAQENDEARAVALADAAVREAQGGGNIADLAGVSRGGAVSQLLTMFYSYFSASHQMIAESNARLRSNLTNPLAHIRWLSDQVTLVLVPALAPTLMFSMLRGGPDDDDEDFADKLLDWTREVLAFRMSTMIGLRELAGLVEGFEYRGPAATKVLVDLGSSGIAGGRIVKAALEGEETPDGQWRKLAKGVLTALGAPSTQIDRTWRGAEFLDKDQSGDYNELGVLFLGPPPKD